MSSLYELTKQQLELKAELLAMNFDEVTIADTLEGSSVEIREKIEAYGFVIRDRQSFAEAMNVEICRMTERYFSEVKRIAAIEERLLLGMIACGIDRHESPCFTITVQNNPPMVEIYNDKLIPEVYMKTPEPPPLPEAKPDKRLMLADMKAGKVIDGCKLVQKSRLVIK